MNGKMAGYVILITGPMFAGKTSQLHLLLNRYLRADVYKVLCITHSIDSRYIYDGESQTLCSTHNNTTFPSMSFSRLEDADKIVEDYNIIGIDEGQFFNDLKPWVSKWTKAKKIIIIAALNGDFQQNAFKSVSEVTALVDEIQYCYAMCRCGNRAIFTHRCVQSTDKILVGGAESYVPLCRNCFPNLDYG